ncbi:MAG: TolC family protein [Thermoanaerobaculia bacterium]
MIGKALALTLLLFAFPLPAEESPAPPASAAPAAPPGVPLTLADATALALANNSDIAVERESFHVVDASLLRADAPYDPTFRLDARYRNHTDPANSLLSGAPPNELAPSSEGYSGAASIGALLPTGGTVSLSASASRDLTNNFLALLSPSYSSSMGIDLRQPLLQNLSVDPARRAIRIARLDKERGAASLKRTVADTVATVERAYWNLVAARRDVQVRAASVGLAAEQRDDTNTKIDVGTLPETDIAQPLAELERRKGDLYASQEQMRRAELGLKLLLLKDSDDPLWNQTLAPVDPPETSVVQVDLADAIRRAESNRPELAEVKTVLAEHDVDVDFAKDRLKPQLDLVAGYARRGLSGSLNPNAPDAEALLGVPVAVPDAMAGGFGRSVGTMREGRFPDASIGLSLSVPVFNRGARADLAIAKAQRSQAEILASQQRQRVAVEVRNAVLTLDTAVQRIDAAKAGRAAAETQLRAEKERYGVGLSTNFFVLTRQNDLAQAVLTETAALTDYRKALTDFARACGTLLDERRIEIRDDAPAVKAEGRNR